MITPKGYNRIRDPEQKRLRFEHVMVWEKQNGSIPKGMQIHHINGDKKDNRIKNLALVTPLEHKRIHSGCFMIGSEWYKPCLKCKKIKEVETGYYKNKVGIMSECKECHVKRAGRDKKKRKNT